LFPRSGCETTSGKKPKRQGQIDEKKNVERSPKKSAFGPPKADKLPQKKSSPFHMKDGRTYKKWWGNIRMRKSTEKQARA